jgi:hypothetical protein
MSGSDCAALTQSSSPDQRNQPSDQRPDDQIRNSRNSPINGDGGVSAIQREHAVERAGKRPGSVVDSGNDVIARIGVQDHQQDSRDDDRRNDPSGQANETCHRVRNRRDRRGASPVGVLRPRSRGVTASAATTSTAVGTGLWLNLGWGGSSPIGRFSRIGHVVSRLPPP